MKSYCTKGEFIQDLKDYKELSTKIYLLDSEYKKKYYERYNKVKSPLDYDIIGYDGNESVRQLKTRGYVSQAQIMERNEYLDNELEEIKEKFVMCSVRMNKANEMLSKIKSPLREIIEDRYIKGKKLKYISKKYSDVFIGQTYAMQVSRFISQGLDEYF